MSTVKEKNMIDEILRMSGSDPKRCMKCGKCSATCPAFAEMEYHPHQFASMIDQGKIQPLLTSEAIYKCLSCFACMERCPRDVKPAKLIEAVRLCVIREQSRNHMTPDDIPCLLDEDLPQQAIVSVFRKYSK